jgi:hypothetical protein
LAHLFGERTVKTGRISTKHEIRRPEPGFSGALRRSGKRRNLLI